MTDKIIIDRYCPKCVSNRVYIDGDFLGCRTCGNRWNPNLKPITKIEGEVMPRTNLDVAKIKELIDQGKSVPEIINETGYKKNSIASLMKRLGIKCKVDGRSLRYKKVSKEVKKKKATPIRQTVKRLSPEKIAEAESLVKAIGIKNYGVDPETALVIGTIDVQIEKLEKRIDKLNNSKQSLIN